MREGIVLFNPLVWTYTLSAALPSLLCRQQLIGEQFSQLKPGILSFVYRKTFLSSTFLSRPSVFDESKKTKQNKIGLVKFACKSQHSISNTGLE